MTSRVEKDAMGEINIPEGKYYGASTQRAVNNFPVSQYRFGRDFIKALGVIKQSAAEVNAELKLLDKKLADAIAQAAQAVIDGKYDDQFVVDVFQTGSGTSTNMNANEVIANVCNQKLTGKLGTKSPVHPNDHVNMGQSSNDVIPTVIHVSTASAISKNLIPTLAKLIATIQKKEKEFSKIFKIGRTHLQDATPITLGQEFGGYRQQLHNVTEDLQYALKRLSELPIGGTAVGTGLNTHPEFGKRMSKMISEKTGIPFVEARNHFEAQSAKDACVITSGALKTLAVALTKIANDIRWLASGPRCALAEINLPSLQPGSSIMPGKVNPVIPEMTLQVCAQVVGHDATLTWASALGSNFELNVMMPLIAYNLLDSARLLNNACHLMAEKCVSGITINADRCQELMEQSLAMITSLVPEIGYDQASDLAKEAFATGKTIRQLLISKKAFSKEKIERLLDAKSMIRS